MEGLKKEAAAKAHIDLIFSTGEIWNCSEEDLKRFLVQLNEQQIRNDSVQHRAVIRALTINHIQMARLLEAQNESNRITQRWFMVLAIGSLIATVASLFF